MNGHDLQQFFTLVEKASTFNMEVKSYGEYIQISKKSGGMIVGTFKNVAEALTFMFGYDLGYLKGKSDRLKKQKI